MSSAIAHNLEEKPRTEDVLLDNNVTFESLLLSDTILKGLTKCGFHKPSPVQLKAIPLGRCGFDLIVKSKAGTGKTAVFSIVALEVIDVENRDLQVIVLAPTREIAVQSCDVLHSIGCEMKELRVEYFIGGTPLEKDIIKAKNCHIAVGAPGRLKHLIHDGHLSTNKVKLFILDEVDKLMNSSFKKDIDEIFEQLPERKQILALSATCDENLESFLSSYMISPTHIDVENNNPFLLGLRQFVVVTKSHSNAIQRMKVKNEKLIELLNHVRFTQCLIFSNFQTRCESVSNYLNNHGWKCDYISACQTQDQRLKTLTKLKKIETRIVSSTDVASRGIDASGVDLVINLDIPRTSVMYLHRMGRAGRYGSHGICINIASDDEELTHLRSVLGSIAGSSFSVAILDNLDANLDLRTVDVNSFKYITGIVQNLDNTLKADIADQVLKIKENSFMQGNKNSKRVRHVHEKNSKVKRLKETEDDNYSEGRDMETNSVPDNFSSKSSVDNENVSCDSKRNALAENLLSADCKTILESLAAGKVDFLCEKADNSDNSNIKMIPPIFNEDNSSMSCKTDVSNNNRNMNANLEMVVDTSHVDGPRSGTKVSECSSAQDGGQRKEEHLLKNSALFYTGKMLQECDEPVIGCFAAKSVENYLKMMKEDEKRFESSLDINDTKDYLKNIDQHLNDYEEYRKCEQMTTPKGEITALIDETVVTDKAIDNKKEIDDVLNSVYSLGYHYATEQSTQHWTQYFSAEHIEGFKQYSAEEMPLQKTYSREKETVEEIEEMDMVSLTDLQTEEEDEDEDEEEDVEYEYDEEYLAQKKAALENQDKEAPPNLSWIPVDHENLKKNTNRKDEMKQLLYISESVIRSDGISESLQTVQNTGNCANEDSGFSITQQPSANQNSYEYYFQLLSDELWNEGLNFESAESFDKWFEKWQFKMMEVRNYIQRKIYLSHMNQ